MQLPGGMCTATLYILRILQLNGQLRDNVHVCYIRPVHSLPQSNTLNKTAYPTNMGINVVYYTNTVIQV